MGNFCIFLCELCVTLCTPSGKTTILNRKGAKVYARSAKYEFLAFSVQTKMQNLFFRGSQYQKTALRRCHP